MISKLDPSFSYFKEVLQPGKCSYFLLLFYLFHTIEMANGNDFVNISNNSIFNIDYDNNSLFINNTKNDTNVMEIGINMTDVLEPPNWQKWLDNSQIAISIIGKSTTTYYKDGDM